MSSAIPDAESRRIASKKHAATELARQLSKLIAALERQRQAELGMPEAAVTAAVLQRTHRLLMALNAGQAAAGLDGATLTGYLDAAWLEANPWAAGPVARIETLLTDSLAAGRNARSTVVPAA